MVLSLLLLIATIVIHAQFYMLFAYLGGMFFTVAMVAKLIESLLEHKEALHQDSNSNH